MHTEITTIYHSLTTIQMPFYCKPHSSIILGAGLVSPTLNHIKPTSEGGLVNTKSTQVYELLSTLVNTAIRINLPA